MKKEDRSRFITVAILLVLEIAILFGGAFFEKNEPAESDEVVQSTDADDVSDEEETESDNSQAKTETESEESEHLSNPDNVEEILANMSLSDMVYQMMFVTPESITGMGTVVQAGDKTKEAIKKYPVGGLIYFTDNFESREQTIEMIKKTQEYSDIPLFIGVDEEGGIVSRLGKKTEMGTTKHPPMQTIGETGDPEKAYEVGKTLAEELKELGFNVDFAPDADVLVNEDNTEIGTRSFGSDPELVAEMVQSLVKGLEENGVSSTLKHFPGHGSTYVNSHTGYSESKRTTDELRECELISFISGIEAGADFVMISHMTPVNITEEKVPCSISKEIITDMLINELGYKGIIITDSLSMGAVTEEYTVGDAAVRAVKAGVDMILMTPDVKNAHDAIVKAVNDGDISEERIKTSVRKILNLKYEKGLF